MGEVVVPLRGGWGAQAVEVAFGVGVDQPGDRQAALVSGGVTVAMWGAMRGSLLQLTCFGQTCAIAADMYHSGHRY